MKKSLSWFLAPVACSIISTVLLCLPGSRIPKEDWLDKIWLDKWVHIGMFMLLVILWCRAFIKFNSESTRHRTYWTIAAICLCYGVIMEFVQLHFINNRSFDIGDIVADAVGCLLGLWFITGRYIKK